MQWTAIGEDLAGERHDPVYILKGTLPLSLGLMVTKVEAERTARRIF